MLSDTTTWISVVGIFSTTCFLLIYLVLNKKLRCFRLNENACCWCCRRPPSNKERISKELVQSFSCEKDQDSPESSDCDEEDLMRQLQQPVEKVSDNYYMSKLNECLNETNKWYWKQTEIKPVLPNHHNHHHHHQNHHHQYHHTIMDPVEEEGERQGLIRSKKGFFMQRQHSICLNDDHGAAAAAAINSTINGPGTGLNNNNNNNLNGYDLNLKNRSKNVLKQQAIYASFALKNNSKTFEMYLANDHNDGKDGKNHDGHHHHHQNKKLAQNDLISLAEKGRIGKQTSTDGSISSETGSAEDCILNSKRNILKRLKTESSDTTESKDLSEHGVDQQHKYQALSNYFDCNYDESDTQSSNLPDFSPNATLSERNLSSMVIKSGRLEISFAYDAPTKRLYVRVIQGDEIPHREQHTSVCQVYVKVILLPQKKQKFRTKSKPIFCPVFDESFTFNRISPEEIANLGLRFRVFSQGFTRKTHLIGESRLLFSCMKPQQQETKLWFTLELPNKRSRLSDLESSSLARTDSTSSQSLQNSSPELLLGLSYNGTTGRLSVTIIKGSQFRCLSTRAPDTYVKLLLISQSGNEMARGKTRVCRGQPNPLFRETFVFQVALFQLPDVTLMIFVYNKRSIKRKELIGWISLGYNSSGDEESSHWNDMRDNKGEQVSRWHVLNEPS